MDGSVGLLYFDIWISKNRRKANLSNSCTMGGGKDGSRSQIAQGCQPVIWHILKVGTLASHNQLKKKMKKNVQPKIQLSLPD